MSSDHVNLDSVCRSLRPIHTPSLGVRAVDANFHDQYIMVYFILYSENQCISKLDKIGIFIESDMKFH